MPSVSGKLRICNFLSDEGTKGRGGVVIMGDQGEIHTSRPTNLQL